MSKHEVHYLQKCFNDMPLCDLEKASLRLALLSVRLIVSAIPIDKSSSDLFYTALQLMNREVLRLENEGAL